jgi:hypothetical protein
VIVPAEHARAAELRMVRFTAFVKDEPAQLRRRDAERARALPPQAVPPEYFQRRSRP